MNRSGLILFVLSLACFNSCSLETPANQLNTTQRELKSSAGMIEIPAGILHMGGDNGQSDKNEFPKHEVSVSAF